MEYPKLISLVPATEHFDASAIGEGVWLSVGHINAIESAMTISETSLAESAASLEAANGNVQTLTDENATLTSDAVTAKTASDAQGAKIVALEAQVALLGAKPSGAGSSLKTDKDDATEKPIVASYASDSNPGNAWMDRQLAHRKKATA